MTKFFQTKLLWLLIPVLGLFLWNCEKDDICDPNTPVTPNLVIDFFNVTDNMPINVTNLAIIAENFPDAEPLIFNGRSSIEIPLNPNEDSVEFTFTLNYGNQDPDLIYTDTIRFNYTRNIEYVSRACGYRTIFFLNNDINLPPAFVFNGATPLTPGSWIKNILIENYNITSNDETHIEIYY